MLIGVLFVWDNIASTVTDHKDVTWLLYLQIMSDITFKSIFKGKQSRLEEKINVDDGLLSRLEEYDIITSRQRTTIEVTIVAVWNL